MQFILVFFSLIFFFYALLKIKKGLIFYTYLLLISLYSFFIALATLNIFTSNFANFWSNKGVVQYGNQVCIYTFVILLFYFFSIKFSSSNLKYKKMKNIDFINKLNNKKKFLSFLKYFSAILLLYSLLHIYYLDFDILWSNDTYLLIASSLALNNINSFSRLLQMLAPLMGLLCCIVFSLGIVLRSKAVIILTFFPTFFYIFLKVGDHSRFSVIYLAVMAFIFFISKNKFEKYILSIVMFIISYFNLLNSLSGRSSGFHGFLSIKNYAFNVYNYFHSGNFFSVIGNIFEGAFVHGELFRIAYHEYPFIFKILSFSPFPSFIDNFDSLALPYSIRFNRFVPIGATGEIFIFGIQYVFFYFFIVFLAIKLNIKLFSNGKNLLFIFTFFLIILAIFLQFTYPVRNVLRFYYLVIFFSIISLYVPRFRWGK